MNKVIDIRLAIITHKAFYKNEPPYLAELILPITARIRRSKYMHLIESTVSISSPSSAQRRSFSLAASTLWNNLPADIRATKEQTNFKRLIKTHYTN